MYTDAVVLKRWHLLAQAAGLVAIVGGMASYCTNSTGLGWVLLGLIMVSR